MDQTDLEIEARLEKAREYFEVKAEAEAEPGESWAVQKVEVPARFSSRTTCTAVLV